MREASPSGYGSFVIRCLKSATTSTGLVLDLLAVVVGLLIASVLFRIAPLTDDDVVNFGAWTAIATVGVFLILFFFVAPARMWVESQRQLAENQSPFEKLYEREKEHSDDWKRQSSQLMELVKSTREGPVTVDQPSPGMLRIGPPQTQDLAADLTFEGSLEHELKRQGEATSQTEDGQHHELAASLGGEGSVKGDLEQTSVDATATGTDPEAERRAEKVARADQLAAEGQFVLDRIRAGMEQHRQHGEDWLVDVYAFFQEHDYPPEVDVPRPQLPLARSRRYPAWARQMATEIDRLLVLLRATANRRYIRVHEVLRATDDDSG